MMKIHQKSNQHIAVSNTNRKKWGKIAHIAAFLDYSNMKT
jgi:hypothetical protein